MENSIEAAKATTGTLCWRCHYAVNEEAPFVCCWAHHLEPRTDWQAERSDTSGGESYRVYECPQYISDKEWREKANESTENQSMPDMREPDHAEDPERF